MPNKYGAGQPSVTHVNEKFHLIYTDSKLALDDLALVQVALDSSLRHLHPPDTA